jgi:hypothetical protein
VILYPYPKHGKCVRVKCQGPDCGTVFYAAQSRIKHGGGKYCSRDCYAAAHRGEVNGKRERKQDAGGRLKVCKLCGRKFRLRNDQHPRWTLWCMACREGDVRELSQGLYYAGRGDHHGAGTGFYVFG